MSSKIFVGNLDFATTAAELTAHLEPAGTIVDIFLPNDRETGRPRGFAFVEFSDPSEAEKAIETFDGSELAGRRLRINAAEDRPPRQGGDGRRFAPPPRIPPSKPKGSRRNRRAKFRSL